MSEPEQPAPAAATVTNPPTDGLAAAYAPVYAVGVQVGYMQGVADKERAVSHAREDAYRMGRTWAKSQPAGVSTRTLLVLLAVGFLVGYFIVGPMLTRLREIGEDETP